MKENKVKERRMNMNKIKTRIIIAVLSVTMVFSGVGMKSFAAEMSTKRVVKEITEFTANTIVHFLPGESATHTLMNKGIGIILGWAFDIDWDGKEEEKGPDIQDVLNRLDEISTSIEKYHNEEMGHLKLINSNIDTKDFRMEADSIADDYKAAIRKMRQHGKNITAPGNGMIDTTTYRTYKTILEDPNCNRSALEKNFNIMKDYVCGTRSSTNYVPGYKITSDYLINKVLANYKETEHDWTKSTDFLEVLDNINGEIDSMQANVVMDCLTILALNNMEYKVREYEITNKIYEPAENEDPYSYYEKFAGDLITALNEMNKKYDSAIENNNEDHELVQAVVELSTPVDGKSKKGFHSFAEGWAEACATGQDFSISGYHDVKALKDVGYNIDKLDTSKYGFTNKPSGHRIAKGRTVSVDMNGHTFDSTADNGVIEVFGMDDTSSLTLKNTYLKGGFNSFRVKEVSGITLNLEHVIISDTRDAAVYFRSPDSKKMKLEMNDCIIRNTNSCSAVRLVSADTVYTIDGCTFENNKSKEGGAIYCPSLNRKNLIINSTFTGNTANGYGGALSVGLANVKGCTFKNNRSSFWGHDETGYGNKGAGGAISTRELICDSCVFENNSTDDQAGAIIVWNRNDDRFRAVAISNSTFTHNTAPNVGGAIRIFNMGSAAEGQYIRDCVFNNNNSGRGAGLFCQHGKRDLINAICSTCGNKGNNVNTGGFLVYIEI